MNDTFASAILHTLSRPQLILPPHPIVDRVRESMRQHFYFNIMEYALVHPNESRVCEITDPQKWSQKIQEFWNCLPYDAQLRMSYHFEVVHHVWDSLSPREKEVTARAVMFQFLIERAYNSEIHDE